MKKQGKVAALFLLPYLLVFLVFRFGPSVAGLFVGFMKWNIVGTASFAGLNNFIKLFRDPIFYTSLKNTLVFLLMTLPPLVVFSLLLAILLNQKLRFRNAVRTISIIPYVLIPAVVGIIWNWLYDNNFGILNYYLKLVGLNPVEWLTNEKYALFSVAIVTVWSFLGYNMILYLAGLQDISKDLYEASEIDGANKYQTFLKITFPLLKPITSMIITLTLINTIQVFDQIFVMTNGGPGTATLTLVQYLYGTAFQNYNLGYGSALGVAILAILIVMVQIQSKLLKLDD
ncbi:sugar ABC transporter permease [Paenibacillus validus]|uniref:ABC transporter permease subunit n=2 Tax=Paenibacillus TaxID=44249 RepID=A0A7X2Z8A1_9BACL|nr:MULTISPECIES: sugar ABC transporter permease [Paenibacillus]MED4599369.1 sugar ABC transporter permease [Paenibacillus validus]MED4606319.1 sugar ABC transporter permease [Paenibacillus validus]MUG70158.1 ABC transporter permease subunit [Paenibacillus validus]